MRVALAQIDPVDADVAHNTEIHLEAITRAREGGADLVVFPELSLAGNVLGAETTDVGLTVDSPALAAIADASRDIDVVVGLVETGDVNPYGRYNSAFTYSGGRLVHRHRKLFLVDYAIFEEGKHFVPGNNLEAFDTSLGRLAVLVCNDLWHSAAPYLAALDGAEVVVVPVNSAQGALGDRLDIRATWEHMTRTHSAVGGHYTVMVNRVGIREAPGVAPYRYWGGSEVIAPDGTTLAKAPYEEEAMVFADLDLDRVRSQRFAAPILRDARLWLFAQEIDRLAARRSAEIGEAEPPPLMRPSA